MELEPGMTQPRPHGWGHSGDPQPVLCPPVPGMGDPSLSQGVSFVPAQGPLSVSRGGDLFAGGRGWPDSGLG